MQNTFTRLKRLFAGADASVIASLLVLLAIFGIAIFAPIVLGLGNDLEPGARLQAPSAKHWFGTDSVGRDIFTRTVSGSRNSVIVGLAVGTLAILIGGGIGLLAGYFSAVDRIVMRVIDGLMAIPGILLAIALASVLGSGILTVIIAIAVPEIPRTARLTRSVVLTLRELPFITAAISVGTSTPKILFRHIVPNAVGALTVQATFVCAAAILSEAALSFLGVGTPPDIPSWGGVMANGRQFFQIAPWIIGFPGLFISVMVLCINIIGDYLRNRLDPRLSRSRAGTT